MSIYRRKTKGKRSRWYTAEFYYRGQLHRRGGFADRESAKHWLVSEQYKLRRGAVGYIKDLKKAQVIPLIRQFVQHLRDNGRDRMYCYTMQQRLERLAGECGWLLLENLTGGSLDDWKKAASKWRGKSIVARTKNQYIDSAREFGAWLSHPQVAKLSLNPFADVTHLPAKLNDEYRRAGTVDELDKLLAACGAERRLFYLFRVYHSKIRGKTLKRLTWRMMRLDAAPPFAETPAEINKSRRSEKHPFRYQIAQELRKLRKRIKAKADDLVFPDAPTLDDLREDLAKAGVTFADAKGNNRLDYHALRSTLVALGKNAGLTAFQVMELLGHRDIRTTMRYYNKASIPAELGAAMEKLPTIGRTRRAQ